MKKIFSFFMLLSFVTAVSASADWILVSKSRLGDEFYIDRTSIQKQSDIATFWLRVNYNQRQSSNALSVKMKDTVNCRKRESASEYMMAYDDIDNKGNLVGSFEVETSWKPIKPDSINWELMNFICK